jgi:hypothetical protein
MSEQRIGLDLSGVDFVLNNHGGLFVDENFAITEYCGT